MNQFLSAWKFTSDHLGYLVALALPVAFMEVSVAYLLLPIQDATQPEDLIEYINSNGSLFLLTAALATIIQMGFVGGIWIAARNFFFMLAITDDRTPAARPGIALARAVGENFNLFHGNWANKAST